VPGGAGPVRLEPIVTEAAVPSSPLPHSARVGRRAILRGLLAAGLSPVSSALAASRVRAASTPDIRFFRIATGASSGTYFPIGSEIASLLSNPPGGRDCAHGGSCGVPGVIAVAQASQGSVENVGLVAKGSVESALCQADVAAQAYAGSLNKDMPTHTLRALANLYSESLHIVVRADSQIRSLKDLKGKRMSLGEPESGTLVDARLVLAAAGINEKDLKPSFTTLASAADGMRDGTVDGFFQIAGYPVPSITELASAMPLRLVPVPEDAVAKLKKKFSFFAQDAIPSGTYPGLDEEVVTVGIGAEWITTSAVEEDLAYLLVKALWSNSARKALDTGHAIGKRILLAKAVDGLALPLHAGAEKFYREIGMSLDSVMLPG